MTYMQINIGRGTGSRKLSKAQWASFIKDMQDALVIYGNAVPHTLETHYGKGTWEGQTEESCHISALTSKDVTIDNFRDVLLSAKLNYDQDAIALVLGSHLI